MLQGEVLAQATAQRSKGEAIDATRDRADGER
jgi:hypothetical protein